MDPGVVTAGCEVRVPVVAPVAAVPAPGVVASAGWKTRIVTLDQSPWQTCRVAMPTRVTTLSLGRAGKDAQRRS